jgi:XTP/dITP diphosphohydrolase
MKIILATGNPDKVAEIRSLWEDLPVDLIPISDLVGYEPPEETGTTLRENAMLKAQAAADFSGMPAVADDTGLEVSALGGEPGVYSSRFAGEHATYEDNRKLLLRRMEGIPESRRQAAFRTVVALCTPDGTCCTADGTCGGTITKTERGAGGFGYDPVFLVPEFGETFAEMSAARKNEISHRGKAFRNARSLINDLLERG